MERDDKDEVEGHVYDSGEGEVVQRPLGVALGPEDGRAEVVEQVGGHSQKVDAQVDGGQADNVGGRGHPLQKLADHRHPEDHHGDAADQGQGHGGVDAMADVVVPPRPQVPGHHHVGAHREAYKQVDGEVDQRGVGAHRRQGLLAGEPAHYHHVRRVEQELQQAGGHQRQGEQQDLVCQRPAAHVNAVFLIHDPSSPFQKTKLFYHKRVGQSRGKMTK